MSLEDRRWEEHPCGWISSAKVDGGKIYRTHNHENMALVFVPDVDLTRYQAHLRDAYKQGFEDGLQEAAIEKPRESI